MVATRHPRPSPPMSAIELAQAFSIVRRRSPAAGRDGVRPEDFAADLERHLDALAAQLSDGRWRPDELLRIRAKKPDGRTRHLAIPTVSDRVVIEALRLRLEPRVEPILSPAAWAYRPRRSARQAVEVVTRAAARGAAWVALADIRDFFDTIPLSDLERQALDLTDDSFVEAALPRLLERHAFRPGRGVAQGSSLSPVLSNLYLTPFDRTLLAAGWDLVRYSDNLAVVTGSERDAQSALRLIRQRLKERGLTLKEANVHPAGRGFRWLGFLIGADGARVSEAAVASLRERVDECARDAGADPRLVALRLEPVIRGWVQYFDAPLPAEADLGPHAPLVRSLITRFSAATADDTLAPVEPVEPWEPEPLVQELWPDEAGARSAGQDARAELLDLADRLATTGDFAGAEAAFMRAQQVETVVGEASEDDEPLIQPFSEAMDAFLGLFCGGQTRFEAASRGGPGRREFAESLQPPGLGEVVAHLNGHAALAIRPRLEDGTSCLGVLDVDPVGADPDAAVSARAYAEAVCSVARERALTLLVERTGGRGLHLWFPVEGRVPADTLASALDRLLALAGSPPAGIRVERLPAADHEADRHAQPMTLPLGVHVETRERATLTWVGGPAVSPELEGIFFAQPNAPETLESLAAPAVLGDEEGGDASVPAAIPDWTRFGAAVRHVWDGCAVVRHLVRKASVTGHLDHAERLSLLYVLGHLGEHGERALHATIGKCRNYDVRTTQQQIERRGPLPISCRRMREKHVDDEALGSACACAFGDVQRRGGYATPLLHAAGFRREWRDALRGRVETREAYREAGDEAGVLVAENVAESEPEAEPPDAAEHQPAPEPETPARPAPALPVGVLVGGCLPPHQWA